MNPAKNLAANRASRPRFVRALALAELPEGARATVTLEGNVIALFHTPENIFAVDNRCPHMGFPLDRGTVKDCILTCHWHHARFDLHSGGGFDTWADDVRAFPLKIEAGAGDSDALLAALGNALLREDRDFHTIQDIEAAFRQYSILRGTAPASHVLVATARYLAAHAPTMRAQAQTFQIALKLNRGERAFEQEEATVQ